MLKTRVVPTLLYKDFGLVKGTAFDSRRAVGSPMQAIKVYEMRGVDELVFFDVTATANNTGPDFALIDDLADECFMPFTVGGGVRSVDDVYRLLQVGADKVCFGTVATTHPEIVGEATRRFGSQSIVVAIDVRRDHAGVRVTRCSGQEDTEFDPVQFARMMEDAGVGELIVQSVDRDGSMDGYDLDILSAICSAVSIPVVASGGAGTYEHLRQAITESDASAVAAASMFHFTHQTPQAAKEYLAEHGIAVRL